MSARRRAMFDQLMGRVAGRFARVEPRRRATALVLGLLADVLGAEVATAALHTWAGQAANGVAAHTEAVRQQLTECGVAGFDETGTPIAGRACWVHAACTKSLTLYQVPARGVTAFEAMGVLPHFQPSRSTAAGSPTRPTPTRTTPCAMRTTCVNSPPSPRTCPRTALRPGRGTSPGCWRTWDQVKAIWAPHPQATGFTVDTLERLAARYEEILAAGRSLHPPRAPGEPCRKRPKAANLLDRLETERDQVLRFAFDWCVPFDNNTSEQAILMAKIQQKISGGWRTMAGAERFFTVRGYLSTAAKHSRNLLDAITRLFDGRGAWFPTPV